ncbi:hypothetical protein L9F63_024010, partial [Diploptera punctata]
STTSRKAFVNHLKCDKCPGSRTAKSSDFIAFEISTGCVHYEHQAVLSWSLWKIRHTQNKHAVSTTAFVPRTTSTRPAISIYLIQFSLDLPIFLLPSGCYFNICNNASQFSLPYISTRFRHSQLNLVLIFSKLNTRYIEIVSCMASTTFDDTLAPSSIFVMCIITFNCTVLLHCIKLCTSNLRVIWTSGSYTEPFKCRTTTLLKRFRFDIILGLPFPLLPCGFQSNAILVESSGVDAI